MKPYIWHIAVGNLAYASGLRVRNTDTRELSFLLLTNVPFFLPLPPSFLSLCFSSGSTDRRGEEGGWRWWWMLIGPATVGRRRSFREREGET